MTRRIIEIEDYSYTYPRQKNPVLQGLSLSINEGEFCLLLGKSGCGKSTLSLSLNGIIPHMLGGKTSGHIAVDGVDVASSSVKDLAKIVSLVFQDPDRQLCNIDVKNEVAFGLENLLFEVDDIKERVQEALEFVGLTGNDMKHVWELSGGQKQRLAVASTLAMRPKVLILDEPTSNLDPVGTVEILETIKKIREQLKCTVLLVEHNLDELYSGVDRVLVMDEGRLLYDDPPQKLMDEKGSRLLDELGLWLPQLSILSLKAREKMLIHSIPLTIDAAIPIFRGHISGIESHGRTLEEKGNIVEVMDLHHQYQDGTKALNGLSLNIKRGDMVAIVGKNGSGKSTLALHFVGILKPTSGRVLVNKKDTVKASLSDLVKDVTYVFQYPEHQFVEGTVFEEVAYSLKGFPKDEVKRTVDDMLTSLGLIDHVEKHPTMLSMGQMRRLSVGAMLVSQPNLIILDEPTYGQDRISALTLMNYMRDLNEAGKTVVFITHNMKLVAEYAKTIVLINDGKVVLQGTSREVFCNTNALAECYLRPPPVSQLTQKIVKTPILTESEFVASLR